MKEAKFTQPNQGQEQTQEQTNVVQQQVVPISLVEVPTQYGLAFKTPVGTLDANDYLVWLGNMILDLKKALIGA